MNYVQTAKWKSLINLKLFDTHEEKHNIHNIRQGEEGRTVQNYVSISHVEF